MKTVLKPIKLIIIIVAFVLSAVLLCSAIILLSLGRTVLDKAYVKQALVEKDVYSGIADEIRVAAKDAYLESPYRSQMLDPFVDPVLKAAVTGEPLRRELEDILDQVYRGDKVEISGEYFIEDYSELINSYVDSLPVMPVPRETVDSAIELMAENIADLAKSNIDVTTITNRYTFYFGFAANNIMLIGGILLGVTAVLLVILVLLSKNKLRALGLPFLCSGLAVGIFTLVFSHFVDTFYILNDSMTSLVLSILKDNLSVFIVCAAVLTGVGLLLVLLQIPVNRRKRKKEEAEPLPA